MVATMLIAAPAPWRRDVTVYSSFICIYCVRKCLHALRTATDMLLRRRKESALVQVRMLRTFKVALVNDRRLRLLRLGRARLTTLS